MTVVAETPAAGYRSSLSSPNLILGIVCILLLGMLTLKLTLPIGPFYWDLFIYFDAANRIFSGQIPAVDFFTPVGPLGYWLFAGFLKLFPLGQPLLLVQWSLLLVTAPLMALVLADVDRRSRRTALALLVPFLLFSILPFNVEDYYFYPGVDGYGIYNRQIVQLIYVLTSGLVFAEGRKTLAVVIVGTMLALFLVKITGFVAGGGLCLFALAAGRIGFGRAAASALAFLAVLAGLELGFGIVGAYVHDILQLLFENEGSLLPRFLQAASIHFGVFAALALLTLALLGLDRRGPVASDASAEQPAGIGKLFALVDRDALWLGTAMLAGLFVETQNTGGQAFLFVWPVLLAILIRWISRRDVGAVLILVLVASAALPTLLGMTQRAARAFVGQTQYERLASDNLKTLGAVSQRPEIMRRARLMLRAYSSFPEASQYLAENSELPSFMLFAEPDYQLTWLMAADEAVTAIRAYEAANGVRFETVMNLNFVNPFPWLLDRQAPLHISIGAVPSRSIPNPDAAVLRAVSGTDLVLYPRCPRTDANDALLALYQPALTGHRRLSLSPCWDAFVRDGLQPKG